MRGYFVQTDNINSLMCDGIERAIERCKHAHHTDLQIRINGAYEYQQADWVKHMLALPEVDDLMAARMEIAVLQDKLRHSEMVAAHYMTLAPQSGQQSPERSKP